MGMTLWVILIFFAQARRISYFVDLYIWKHPPKEGYIRRREIYITKY